MDRITSRHNPVVARFRESARASGPDAPLLLDGVHLVETALAAAIPITLAAVRDPPPARDAAHLAGVVARLSTRGVRTVAVSAPVMDAISPVRSASPIVALAARGRTRPGDLLVPSPALVLVAAGVQDPGNLGAIVRSADAAGATGVVATAGSADPFGWKALRGSMGSTLRLPVWVRAVWRDVEASLQQARLAIVGADASGQQSLYDCDLTGPTALVVGAEGKGLPSEVLASCHATVRIPMRLGVESLNVAVTAALLAYEAKRQRAKVEGHKLKGKG